MRGAGERWQGKDGGDGGRRGEELKKNAPVFLKFLTNWVTRKRKIASKKGNQRRGKNLAVPVTMQSLACVAPSCLDIIIKLNLIQQSSPCCNCMYTEIFMVKFTA